jgi:hypothetical protein
VSKFTLTSFHEIHSGLRHEHASLFILSVSDRENSYITLEPGLYSLEATLEMFDVSKVLPWPLSPIVTALTLMADPRTNASFSNFEPETENFLEIKLLIFESFVVNIFNFKLGDFEVTI